MLKPQEKYEAELIKSRYSERVLSYYNTLVETFQICQKETLDVLVEGVYKEAYLDGFKDAIFFTDKN